MYSKDRAGGRQLCSVIYSERYSNESTAYNTVVKNQTPQTPSPESLDPDTVSLTHRVSGE